MNRRFALVEMLPNPLRCSKTRNDRWESNIGNRSGTSLRKEIWEIIDGANWRLPRVEICGLEEASGVRTQGPIE